MKSGVIVSKTKLGVRDYFSFCCNWVNSFEEEGRRLIGRYDEGRSRGFPSLWISTMIECFHVEGM